MNDRDPIICPKCQAVNPWNREVCRICESRLDKTVPANEPEDPSADMPEPEKPSAVPSPAKRGLSWRWIIRGGLITLLFFLLADGLIALLIVKGTELKQFVDVVQNIQEDEETDDMKQVEEYVNHLESSNPGFVQTVRRSILGLIALLVLAPLLGGAVVGWFMFPFGLLEAGLAAGAGAVLMSAAKVSAAIIFAPVSFVLGLAGAFIIRLIRMKMILNRSSGPDRPSGE